MTRMPHPALTWTANLLVPGAGLVLLGRVVLGAVLGLGWGLALSGLLLVTLVWPDGTGTSWPAGLGVGAAAVYGLAQFLHGLRRRATARHFGGAGRDETFRTALVAYLQGRLDDAEALCKELLKRDPGDVEAVLHLGYVAQRRGDAPAAHRHFARARYLDDEGRWDFQISRELAELHPPKSSAAQ